MANKFWTHLKLKNGDSVQFIPPAPNGDLLGGISVQEKQKIADTETEIGKIKGELSDQHDEFLTFAKTGIIPFTPSDYVRGGINNQTGENATNIWLYRVSSSNWFGVEKDTEVFIDDDFKIIVLYKEGETYQAGSYVSNVKTSYTFLASKQYKITIMRDVENTGETANISEFASKLTQGSIIKTLSNDVESLKDFTEAYSGFEVLKTERVENKYVVTGGATNGNGYEYAQISVSDSDRIKITTNANSAAKMAMYFSGEPVSANYLGTEAYTYPANYGTAKLVDYDLTIPAGTKVICINNRIAEGEMIIYKYTDKYIADEVKNYVGKKILLLGDSITQLGMGERGWVRYFDRIVKAEKIDNVAVIGAHWCDYNSTTVYNGNPIADSSEQNVIGNQVQKIINNRASYLDDYDYIFICAGTNDPTSNGVLLNTDVNAQFYSGSSVKALTDVDRSTWAGATRWVTETLHGLFPSAKIVFNTPINRVSGYEVGRVYHNAKMVRQCAEVNGVMLCDAMHCGIRATDPADFVDNLHPSVTGAKKLGEFVANWFKNNCW